MLRERRIFGAERVEDRHERLWGRWKGGADVKSLILYVLHISNASAASLGLVFLMNCLCVKIQQIQ